VSGPTARRAHRAPHTSQLRPWQAHLRGSLVGVLPGRRGAPRHRALPAQAPQRPQIRLSPGPIGLLLAGVVLVAGSGALGSLGLTSGTMSTATAGKRPAGTLATPVPPVAQPAAIEAPAPYLPQVSCNPVAMPGAVALGDLLRATYPGTSYGIPRACGTDGMASEHYEGRAIDWFTSVRDTTGAARATTVLNWLLATMNEQSRPASFKPYTAGEIAVHRRPALTDVARTRMKLVKELQENGVDAVPEHY